MKICRANFSRAMIFTLSTPSPPPDSGGEILFFGGEFETREYHFFSARRNFSFATGEFLRFRITRGEDSPRMHIINFVDALYGTS